MTRLTSDILDKFLSALELAYEVLDELTLPSVVEHGISSEQLRPYVASLETLVAEAEAVDAMGLQDLCHLLVADLGELTAENPPTAAQLQLQQEALSHAIDYVDQKGTQGTTEALVRHFQAEGWCDPLHDDDVDVLIGMLCLHEPEALVVEPTSEVVEKSLPTTDFHEVEEVGGPPACVLTDDVLLLLGQEVGNYAEAVAALLALAQNSTADNAWCEAFNASLAEFELFGEAASALAMDGLAEVCFHLAENYRAIAKINSQPSDELWTLLFQWPDLLLGYLGQVNEMAMAQSVVTYLADSLWPMPLPEGDYNALLELLTSPVIEEVAVQHALRPSADEISQEDVSLVLPDDVNSDLLDAMLQELPLQTSEFSAAIKKLVDGEGGLDDVKSAQRIAHSLKGAGNTVGVRGIATLTHHLEDILQAFFDNNRLPHGALAVALMDAADCLEAMSEALMGVGAPPSHAMQILKDVLGWASRIDEQGLDVVAEALPTLDSASASKTSVSSASVFESSVDANVIQSSGTMVRVPAELMDELLRFGGEGTIITGQVQNRVNHLRAEVRSMREKYRMVQQLTYELDQLVSVSGLLSSSVRDHAGVDNAELEQYNELHSCLSRLEEAVADSREFTERIHEDVYALEDLAIEQDRLQKDNQETIYRSRMVPVSTIVPRCERGIRQACRLTDKSVDFRIEGSDTMMDSQVLSDFIEPLMHLLRNSVDHGIESPEQRRLCGKPESGSIVLNFARAGDLIEVTCQDDGAGLDAQRIRETAIERGVIREDDALTDDELDQLILLPGFTTKGEATQVSGRGIGMDAVYAKIKEMKGALSLHSRFGEGLRVVLQLPVSMLSVPSTLVRCGGESVVVSNYGVVNVVDSIDGQIIDSEGELVFVYAEERLPATYLEMLMGRSAQAKSKLSVFIVQSDVGTKRAVFTDSVVFSGEMVVKNMGAYIPPIAGMVGVTILGDGSVAPVLDIPELLRTERHGHHVLHQSAPVDVDKSHVMRALVVDDSLSARRALANFLEDSGYEVDTAIDGADAINVINQQLPDILLVDMEMPRMNGIELTAHLRADERSRDIPVVMITSRSTAKHKAEAKQAGVDVYLIKPFNEVELEHHINVLLS